MANVPIEGELSARKVIPQEEGEHARMVEDATRFSDRHHRLDPQQADINIVRRALVVHGD